MSKYLIKTVETYRADTEAEAAQLIDEAKTDGRFILAKYSNIAKELKAKGEVVDCWQHVELTKVFDSEKEPSGSTRVTYSEESAF